MARISGGDSIATPQLGCKRRLMNRAGEAAATELVVATVPVLLRQPQLETDLRVRCRLRLALHATERRHVEFGLDSIHVGDANVRQPLQREARSEERRVGKECRSRWSAD